MIGGRKKSILLALFMLVCLFLSFLIFYNALETNQVEESQVSAQPVMEGDQTKKTDATEKEAKPKRALPSTSPKKNFTIVIDPGHQQRANNDQEPVAPGSKETKGKVSSVQENPSTN